MREFRVWAALLRIAIGGVWIFEAYPQLASRESYLADGFGKMVQAMASGNPWSFYREFLMRIVLPHASVFSYLTLVGNILIGVCLLVGLLTPYAAGLAMLLNVNYALADGWMNRMSYSLNAALFFGELVIIALMAGQVLGIDARLGGGPERKRARRY